jgi:2-haloacid dehalogenase
MTETRQAGDRPDAVVFDLGGVLIDWNPRHLYRKVFYGDEEAMESFLATVTTPEWNARQDAGRPWAEAIETLVSEHPDKADLIVAYRDRWIETLGGPIEATVEVLDALRATPVRLVAMSNWSAETFPLARPLYPFLEWFEGIVVSGELGIAKPDPRIYRHLIERFMLHPASTIFIDDSAANVRAAEDAGLIGMRFDGAAGLRRDLAAHGLLEEAEPTRR